MAGGIAERPLVHRAARPEVDRLEWRATPESVAPGRIAIQPSAIARRSVVHAATTVDGTPAWVRVPRHGAFTPEAGAQDHRMASTLARAMGFRAPGLIGVQPNGIWFERIRTEAAATPRSDEVDRFVESAITLTLLEGVVLATGRPHVDADGFLVVDDCGVVACLEPDERAALARVLRGFATRDPAAVTAAVAASTGAPARALDAAAGRACAALAVDWSPVALGLSVYQMAGVAAMLGNPGDSLSLFADELLSRLDLLYAHPSGTTALDCPRRLTLLFAVGGHHR
jgi:hypothetical protein